MDRVGATGSRLGWGRGLRRPVLARRGGEWRRGARAAFRGQKKSFSEEGPHEVLDPGLRSDGPLVARQPSGRVPSRWSCTLPGLVP